MKWAWKLGRVAGIEIRIHVTFLLLLIWIGALHYLEGHNWRAAALGILFILAVFSVIVLHELGHALTARRFGVRTFDITLLPIGGVARLDHIPERPLHEFLVAIAGPAVNLAIGLILLVLLGTRETAPGILQGISTPAGFLTRFAFVNLGLALFNLLPAFPMDGGRAFRALLSTRMSHLEATRIAATLGKGLALSFGFLGIFYNPVLALIGLFIWITASDEVSATRLKAGIEGITVRQAMITEFHIVAPEDPLSLPVGHLLHSRQQDFPVCQDGRIIGLLTHRGLLAALQQHGDGSPVSAAMEKQFNTVGPEEQLTEAIHRLNPAGAPALPVVQGDQVLGLLTLEGFAEMWMILAALHKERP